MTNKDAIQRVQQKVNYLTGQIAKTTDERTKFWQGQDLAAFEIALAAITFVEQMAEYEASQQVPTV